MAYIRPHGNRIVFRFRIAGHELSTTVELKPTKTNLAAAKRQAQQAEYRLKSGEPWESVRADLRGERITVPNSLGYYAQHLLDHADVENSTLLSYESIYNRYWAPFDHRSVDTLLRSELESHLAGFKVGRKTKRNALSVLRRIFELARRDRVITEAPTDDWELKKGQTPEPDPYTEEERDKLLLKLERWPIAHQYFVMAFHSGMRTGELLGLEWRALEKPYGTVDQARVRRNITTTKTNQIRRVILPPIVWDTLDKNPTRFKRSYVFLTPEGRAFIDADWLMDKWDKAHQLASVRKRTGPYPWRHTYISLGLSKGATLIWMSKQTGHDMITMQDKYARWIDARRDADREELEKVYN